MPELTRNEILPPPHFQLRTFLCYPSGSDMQTFPVEMLDCTLQTQGSCMPNELLCHQAHLGQLSRPLNISFMFNVVQSLKKIVLQMLSSACSFKLSYWENTGGFYSCWSSPGKPLKASKGGRTGWKKKILIT